MITLSGLGIRQDERAQVFPAPAYETKGSAGFDIRSVEAVTVEPWERQVVSTGLFLTEAEITCPVVLSAKAKAQAAAGGGEIIFELQIRPRSGLALKHGIAVLNTPGTVDSDYQGEIKVILVNFSSVPFVVTPGDRIAQCVFAQVLRPDGIETKDRKRNSGGFSSTGIK